MALPVLLAGMMHVGKLVIQVKLFSILKFEWLTRWVMIANLVSKVRFGSRGITLCRSIGIAPKPRPKQLPKKVGCAPVMWPQSMRTVLFLSKTESRI